MANRTPSDPNVTAEIGRTLVDFIQNLQLNTGGSGNKNSRATEQFREYRPPTFNGRDGPAAVEEWLRSIERIFRMVDCDDAQKIACATYQLIEDAGHWWESFTRNQTEDERLAFTWENFKTTVNSKYFPQSYADRKESEFLNLKQGNMTMTDYERKFNELSRFAPHLVNTDDRRSSRFLRGLRPEIGGILVAHEGLAYAELVRRAERVENVLEKSESELKIVAKEKRKWIEEDDDNETYKQARVGGGKESTMRSNKPQCKNCGKYHFGVCTSKRGKCFNCHQPRHYANKCPQLNQGSG